MRRLLLFAAGAVLASCTYYVPIPAGGEYQAGAPPMVAAPAAPVYAYPYPYPYPYPAYGPAFYGPPFGFGASFLFGGRFGGRGFHRGFHRGRFHRADLRGEDGIALA